MDSNKKLKKIVREEIEQVLEEDRDKQSIYDVLFQISELSKFENTNTSQNAFNALTEIHKIVDKILAGYA